MKCLVTGSAGFIGQHLVRRLERNGHEVVCIDLLNGVDLTVVNCLPEGTEVVFHLAAATGLHRRFDDYLRNNVVATQRLLEACKGAKLKKFVLASTSSVYGLYNDDGTEKADTAPVSWYGCTKLAAEDLCKMYQRYEFPLTVLRLFSVYGPDQRPDMGIRKFMDAIFHGNQIQVYGNGSQVRSYTYVDDVVEALVMPLPRGTYNVSGSSHNTVEELVDLLRKVTGKNVGVAQVPARQGEQLYAVGDCSKLIRRGWSAKVSLEEGLRRQWEWQKNL